jgi:hypothetical protein
VKDVQGTWRGLSTCQFHDLRSSTTHASQGYAHPESRPLRHQPITQLKWPLELCKIKNHVCLMLGALLTHMVRKRFPIDNTV